MTADTVFRGQPGDPEDDPQVDVTITALHAALDHLTSAAHAVECTLPEAGRFVDSHLDEATTIALGFTPDSDESYGLLLLAKAIRRAKEEA